MNDKFRVSDLAENTDGGLDKFNGNNKNIIAEENNKLLVAWIGKNADKILNINQNISALFLGELYFFYRKMYLEGLILFILKLCLFIILPYKYLVIILNMLLFFITNSIYKNFIKRNIKKLKNTYSSSKIENECIKRGGTSLLPFVIIALAEALMLSFYIYKYVDIDKYIPKKTTVQKESKTSKKTKKVVKTKKFDGKLDIKDLGYNDLDFGYPSHWKTSGSKASYVFDTTKDDSSCEVILGTLDNYSDAKDLTNQIKEYYKINDLTNTTKNTIKWYRITHEDEENITIYAFSDYEGKVLVYKFIIEKNADKEKCRQIDREIFRNIKPIGYEENMTNEDSQSAANE